MLITEQHTTQSRRQRQRNDTRQSHRNGYRDGKLLIELAGNTAQKRNRHKHRTQHQHNGNDCARHLTHGFNGGLLGWQAALFHQPLNILQDDNGIIDDDTNRQHHGEQCHRVD